MNRDLSSVTAQARPSRVRYGVLGFACALSMITYLDRACFGTVAPIIRNEFGLDKFRMGMLFFAFAFAYGIFEVPTGWLGDMFGPRKTLIRIVLWWSLFTALTGAIYPSSAWPWFAFIAMLCVRFLFGVGEAGAYPNIARAFYNWFPYSERGSAQGAVWMAGRFAGGLAPLAVLALIYTVQTDDGQTVTHWRHVFWSFGGIGVVWCVLFWWWFRDRPEQHPSVNPAELAFIHGTPQLPHPRTPSAKEGEGEQGIVTETSRAGIQPPPPLAIQAPSPAPGHADASHTNVPWRLMLTNLNLWVLCLMYFCAAYGWYFNITWLPDYLEWRYEVNLKTYGLWQMSLLSGAPLLLGSAACLVGGLMTDTFIRRTGDRKWGRRLFGMIGHGVCALCYFLSLAAPSPWLFILAVALAAFWNDLTMGAAWASCIDIGGKYSGIVSGCMNTIGNLGGAVAGLATGGVLKLFGEEWGWKINFISFGMVYVLAMFLWLRFDATQPIVPE